METEQNNNITNLQYPIIQIGKNLYQEKKPGDLHIWSLAFAKAKYGSNVKSEIKYCLGFTCDPSHLDYHSVIDDMYNKYIKLSHDTIKGEWNTIEGFLKHIFGRDNFQMALEYFWNLYVNPKQKLPFLGLVSGKKGTGKSTFLRFLKDLFQDNVAVVSAIDFQSQFNEHFANSLILISDEHAEGKERIKVAEKLKMYITEQDIRIEAKFAKTYTSKSYFKLVFAGNNEEMLTIIENENTRYWIVQVPQLRKTDFNIQNKLKKEIPMFLYYLINDFKPREKRGRLYFNPDEFQTEASKLIQENSKPKLQQDIETHILDCFEQNENVLEIYYAPKDLQKALRINDLKLIRHTLKKLMGMEPTGIPISYSPGVDDHEEVRLKITGRPYKFLRKNFIHLKEMEFSQKTSRNSTNILSEDQIEAIMDDYYN